MAEKITLSGLIALTMIIFLRQSHLFSHSPGSPSLSGVEELYHLFHSLELCVNAPTMPVKLVNLSISHIMFQDESVIQSGLGFGGYYFLSTVGSPPFLLINKIE